MKCRIRRIGLALLSVAVVPSLALARSDTSGLEVSPAPEGSTSFVRVHEYPLVQQGVHILEFHLSLIHI